MGTRHLYYGTVDLGVYEEVEDQKQQALVRKIGGEMAIRAVCVKDHRIGGADTQAGIDARRTYTLALPPFTALTGTLAIKDGATTVTTFGTVRFDSCRNMSFGQKWLSRVEYTFSKAW